MKPFDFQQRVADLLAATDCHVSWVSPPGADGGGDWIRGQLLVLLPEPEFGSCRDVMS